MERIQEVEELEEEEELMTSQRPCALKLWCRRKSCLLIRQAGKSQSRDELAPS